MRLIWQGTPVGIYAQGVVREFMIITHRSPEIWQNPDEPQVVEYAEATHHLYYRRPDEMWARYVSGSDDISGSTQVTITHLKDKAERMDLADAKGVCLI